MKSMKNIKPSYAVQLGKGVFAGGYDDEFATIWICSYCKKRVRSNGEPSSDGEECPGSTLKNREHLWIPYKE